MRSSSDIFLDIVVKFFYPGFFFLKEMLHKESWKEWFNPFQLSGVFQIETRYLFHFHFKSNCRFLYEMQHWPEIG